VHNTSADFQQQLNNSALPSSLGGANICRYWDPERQSLQLCHRKWILNFFILQPIDFIT
jgi:hypothetical protein